MLNHTNGFQKDIWQRRYISSNVSIESDYIHKLQDRVMMLIDSEHPPHIHKFLKLCVEIVQKDKKTK